MTLKALPWSFAAPCNVIAKPGMVRRILGEDKMARLKKLIGCLNALVFFVGLFMFTSYFWVGHNFYNVTLDVIIIHLILPLKGADSRYFWEVGGLIAVVVVVSVIYGLAYWQSGKRKKFLGLRPLTFRISSVVLSVVLVVASAWLIERRYHLYDFIFPGELFSSFVEDNSYLPPVEAITFPEGSNNLVLIVLESVESTVNDTEYFNPVLMPELLGRSKQGVRLLGQRQVVGTEFSLSSFFALTLGMPAKSNFNTRDVVNIAMGRIAEEDLKYDDFMGTRDWKESSVLGILERNGHHVSLMRAADARFCNYIGLIRQSTKECDVWDLKYFLDNRYIEEEQNAWGVYDGYLYDRAREYLAANHQKGAFTMVIQTVDTHQPGFPEPGMEQLHGDLRDAYIQGDKLASDFIQWVQDQPFGEKTTIVVVGDHLTIMGKIGAVSLPPAEQRSIMAFILNSRKGAPGDTIERLYATWDLAPTILEALGADLPQSRFGLGTSLFSEKRNLLERVGASRYNVDIRKRSHYSEKYYGW